MSNIYVPETGQVQVIGNTKVELGDKIDDHIRRLRPRAADLKFMERKDVIITSINHKFGKKSGFVTTIGWQKKKDP